MSGCGRSPNLLRVARVEEITAPAWAAYRTSLLYLALLFGAMIVDRAAAVLIG